MLRISGVCILCVVTFLWGNGHVTALLKKIRFFEAMIELVRYSAGRIDYLTMPLDEIYESFYNEYFESTGFSEAMRQRGLSTAIKESADLEEADRQFFLGFSNALGSNCREEEVKLCRYYLEEMTRVLSDLKADYPGKAKLWRSLPVLGSLSLFLFLL